MGSAKRREQEVAQLARRPQVGVPDRGLDPRPVLHRVEGQVGPRGQPVADDRAGAPVVDAGPPQLAEEPVRAGRAHPAQPPEDQPRLARVHAALASQQPGDDEGRVVVVDVEGERGGVQAGIVGVDVVVQEAQGEALPPGVAVELALAGRGDRGVGEEQHVLALDQIGVGLHGSPDVVSDWPGNGGANCERSR
ncbi:hypothetical protein AB0K67_17305 [Nonomuraea sp. NPDC052634]|uniref:hypothetical protein n=1 Tax=Nonomuraea sp. NPDC052634 TaxID=3155813 RepID=UPI003446CACB